MKPATAVLESIQRGNNNIHDISRDTGLREQLVQTVIHALKASGALGHESLASACLSGKECSGCPVNNTCGSAVLLTLSVPRHVHE